VLLLGVATPWAQEPPSEGYAPLPEYHEFGIPAAESDSEAILALMGRFGRAWGNQDIEGAVAAYAEDAEWVNAFGDVRRGHAEMRDQFTSLFERFESGSGMPDEEEGSERGELDAAEAAAEPAMARGPISMRYVGPEVAVLHSYVESDWGVNRDGEGLRRVHMTWVLEKRRGEWLIVHHMIMDARR
jgi:ketosteroid isomerase-like protein